MGKYEDFRQKHPTFIYHGYDIGDDCFFFHFSIDKFDFYPSWKMDKEYFKNYDELTEEIIFSIGMAELVSYWKCACCPTVIVKCGHLTDEMCRWWKKLYFNGLGEFFYKNGIEADFDSFMNIIPENKDVKPLKSDKKLSGFLIPVGGGKDSVVTLELLKEYHDDTLCYIINPRGATVNCAKTAGFDESNTIGFRRTIAKSLIERNAEGYLNGHTPFSAIVAFSSYLCAYLEGKKYIALSNESSANESNVGGTEINHQYSKSTEFERDFREYTHKYLDGEIEYFSMLRPWSEWQIAKHFSQYPKYFSIFQSCNLGSKTDIWCCDCAKCLYVYIILSAFLDDKMLLEIFGCDMLDNEKFENMFNGLIYENIDKPFECVGTKEEVRLALYTAAEIRDGNKLPLLLDKYMKTNPEKPQSLDDYFDKDNFVPEHLISLLK